MLQRGMLAGKSSLAPNMSTMIGTPSTKTTIVYTAVKQPQKARDIRLDVLRGIAILLVIGRHNQQAVETAGFFAPIARFIRETGWVGVDLFFVLSGYLVGGLLMKEIQRTGRLDFTRFVLRRGFKIWPSYIALILVAYAGWTIPVKPDWQWWPAFTHLVSYGDPLKQPRGHLWSLSIEEAFYLLLPYLLLLFLHVRKSSIHDLPMLAALVIIVEPILRYIAYDGRHSWLDVYFMTHLRLDGLFLGVLLAYCSHFRPHIWAKLTARPLLMIAAGLLLLLPEFLSTPIDSGPFVVTWGLSFLAFGFACILCGFMGLRPFTGWTARIVAFIGFYSYSIYVWHTDVREFLPKSLPWPSFMLYFAALSIAVGVFLGAVIEFPCLRLRDRLFPSR